GKPEATDIHSLGAMSPAEILVLVARAETISEHHLGQTIVKDAEAKALDLSQYELTDSEAIQGHGITATVNSHRIAAGNRKLMEAQGISIDDKAAKYAITREKAGNTAIYIAINGKLEAI